MRGFICGLALFLVCLIWVGPVHGQCANGVCQVPQLAPPLPAVQRVFRSVVENQPVRSTVRSAFRSGDCNCSGDCTCSGGCDCQSARAQHQVQPYRVHQYRTLPAIVRERQACRQALRQSYGVNGFRVYRVW